MVIGLTGRNAAGKGEVAKYLQTKSFYYYSFSDAIRDELRNRKLDSQSRSAHPNRETNCGWRLAVRSGGSHSRKDRNRPELRHRFHPESRRSRRIAKSQRSISKLIKVDAPVQVRFERTVARRRESDPITFEDFVVA